MWLNDKEEKIYGPFSKYIENHEDRRFRFIYEDGCELITEFFTEYESDNGLEPSKKDMKNILRVLLRLSKLSRMKRISTKPANIF